MSDGIKKLKEAYAEVVSGKVEEIVEETVSEDIDPELLKKAAVGKKKADDEEKDGKKAVPAGKDVDVDDESDEDEKEEKPVPPKKKKKDDDEEKEEPPVDEDNTNDKSDDGEGLDKVQPKAVKKKFADRKDKDIDNDGDVDDSDKFLHKRRKAVSKAMAKESFEESTAELIEALSNMFERKETAGATAPEGLVDKESPKSKEFIDAHKKSDKKIEDNYDDAVDKTTAAGKGGPSPKKRAGDNANGDPKPKGVKEESELIKRTLEQLRK